jgi:hypothetical protein
VLAQNRTAGDQVSAFKLQQQHNTAAASAAMEGNSSKRFVLSVCAAAAAGAAGVLWLKRSMMQQQGLAPTDFDAFLAVPAAAKKKPAKKASRSAAKVTDFESFLKVQPVSAEPCATDFLSFLKDGGNSSSAAQVGGMCQRSNVSKPVAWCDVSVLYVSSRHMQGLARWEGAGEYRHARWGKQQRSTKARCFKMISQGSGLGWCCNQQIRYTKGCWHPWPVDSRGDKHQQS